MPTSAWLVIGLIGVTLLLLMFLSGGKEKEEDDSGPNVPPGAAF